jgi:type II secretory pathway component GspD/PulD (secretin)
MKTINLILSAGVACGLFAATAALGDDATATNNAPAPAGDTNAADATLKPPPPDATPTTETPPAPDDKSAPAVTPPGDQVDSSTNMVVDPVTGELKLRIQFRNAPLETVLKYMSSAAGYVISEKVPVSGKVTVWSEQPLNKEEALVLVKKVLDENGYTAMQDGRILTIIRSSDAKKDNIPVIVGNIPTNIPIDTEIVTQIIPVRSLNAVSLLKDLQPLLPADTTLTANESGNALVMTDTQANIHRITEIVRGLDSVNSSSATIIVFPLKYADAKSVASLIKDLFPSASASAGGPGGGSGFGGFFSRFRGGGGGFPGAGGDSGGGAANDTGAGHTPSSRVTAVSDDHANSLVVSAPDDLVPTIKQLVASLDTDVEDTTVLKVFELRYADANETASELSSLFPDDSKPDDNSNFSSRFRFGFFTPPQASPASNESDHVRRQNRVLAVPDPRTRSLIVSASKDMMPQIATMIERLDNNPRNMMHVYVMNLTNAEVQDVLPVVQDLFPSGNKSSSSTASSLIQNNPLTTRSTAFTSQANSTTAQPFGSTGTSGRTSGGQ